MQGLDRILRQTQPAALEPLVPADVVGPTGQGIAPGEFAELVRAMRNGATYVNVHSTMFPKGEIRGNIRRAD
jgi:hypothetical protein